MCGCVIKEMAGLDPVTELTNSTTGKAYEESIDIATFGTKETYQLFKDIKKTFRKSPGYQVILKGVLWKLPIDMAIELFKFAIEVYDDKVAATVQTRTNECVQYGIVEINKYPGELENKDPQLIGFLYQVMSLHRKQDYEATVAELDHVEELLAAQNKTVIDPRRYVSRMSSSPTLVNRRTGAKFHLQFARGRQVSSP